MPPLPAVLRPVQYTGEGGRDLKGTKAAPKNLRTAAQSKDQVLTKGNLALSVSARTGTPVRVVRGFKNDSVFAPEYGYRYDGLYTVSKFWSCTGMAGFKVYKYALTRLPGQAPPPWTAATANSALHVAAAKEARATGAAGTGSGAGAGTGAGASSPAGGAGTGRTTP